MRLLYCQKLGNFKFFPLKNNLCHQKAHKKLHIRHYYGYFGFLSGLRVIAASKCENGQSGENFLGTSLKISFQLLITLQEREKLWQA